MKRKLAVITGGTKGIGLATADKLARSGHDLVLGYRRDAEQAEIAASHLRSLAEVHLVESDLTDGPGGLIDATMGLDRPVEVLVANAAASAFKPLIEIEPRHIEKTVGVTFVTFIGLVSGLVDRMPPGASVVAVSGGDSFRFIQGHGLLGAAKAGLEALVRYFAVELGGRGIRVNAVLPGPVDTESARIWAIKTNTWEPFLDRVRRATPLGRIATAEDIAGAIALLCSEDAGWINGHTLIADGGMFARDLIFDPGDAT